MLQIRLNKGPSSDGGSIVKSLPAETVTVACPDHLVLADLPVAKGLGSATSSARVKTIGRRSRRQLGERVHFCVRCDFPIATYGRLTPCEHVFCLDCARSDSMCYLCDDRIQKIQTIKLMEGIFICAAPHCLKSFLKKTEFETHIHETHGDLLQPNLKKEGGNDFDPFSVKQSAASESSVRAPQKQAFPPSMNSQSREQTPLRPLMPPRMPQYHLQSSKTPSDLPHQNFEASTEKQQQGILSDPHQFHYQQPPFFGQERPPFGFPPFTPDRAPPFYGTPMNLGSAEQGSMAGYPSAPPGFELTLQQGIVGDGLDPQTRGGSRADSMPPPPPPGPPPPHLLHQKNDSYFSAEPSHDANNYNWS